MEFFKYSGLGNDFILMDNRKNNIEMNGELAKEMCNRYFGIGADGLVLAAASHNHHIRMDIFNSDGSRAEMCGNASRCFAKFLYEKGIVRKKRIEIETLAGRIVPELKLEDGIVKSVKVDMGKPLLRSRDIPFSESLDQVINYPIIVDGLEYRVTSMFMGVPHTVIFGDNIDDDYVIRIGRKIEESRYFPRKTNVNFVSLIDRDEIILRTWERGVGYTMACGTGASASLIAGILNGKLNNKVLVHLRGGDLTIEFLDGRVYMTGGAREIFKGFYRQKER